MTRAIVVLYWLKSNDRTRRWRKRDGDVHFPRRLKMLLILFAVVLLLLAIVTVAPVVLAQGLTLTVTGYGDFSDLTPGDSLCDTNATLPGEQCSLRAAIEELNQQDPNELHRIEFNVTLGNPPFTIAPASPLPTIDVPVELDASTQPGASCPRRLAPANLLIVLDGSNAGNGVEGLVLSTGSSGSAIRGMVIGNFDGTGLEIRTASHNNRITCNHIGVGADGVIDVGNGGYGIWVGGDNNVIGGPAAAQTRNVISGNDNTGVFFSAGAENNLIANNFIGTTADGMQALGNSTGVAIYQGQEGNNIGGAFALSRNVISGNNREGIDSQGQGSLIQGNLIGVARDGVTPLPNQLHGIHLHGSTETIVGGTNAGEANVIAYNVGDGVSVETNAVLQLVPEKNEIRGNAVFGNGGRGIDLGGDGVDTNDHGDGDGGENERQNYPILQTTAGSSILNAILNSQTETTYIVDLYRSDSCDPSGYGEGQVHFFTGDVTTSSFGQALFSLNMASWSASPGDFITATATDPQGNTSEFSACVLLDYEPGGTATYTPTPTATTTEGPSPTPTATATEGPSPTPTATATEGPSPTPTATATERPQSTFVNYLPVIRK